MKDILNRIPGEGKSNRKKLIHSDGSVEYVFLEYADEPVEPGTPINRENLMAMQGFDNINVDIDEDENGNITVTEINGDNHALTVNITENDDGTVTVVETFVGEKTITKTSIINADGTQISGVVK